MTLTHIDNGFGLPALAPCVRTRAEGWLTLGFAARADSEAAALKLPCCGPPRLLGPDAGSCLQTQRGHAGGPVTSP
ncbi:hypothetical protein ACIPC1_12845 [Streptomyces sp. NPDC087263]|uniref:hypothetical protein n=1 Tax=Streptomyces sp. NPDC087263 TaxID=3365773 RepID=UPI00381235B2